MISGSSGKISILSSCCYVGTVLLLGHSTAVLPRCKHTAHAQLKTVTQLRIEQVDKPRRVSLHYAPLGCNPNTQSAKHTVSMRHTAPRHWFLSTLSYAPSFRPYSCAV